MLVTRPKGRPKRILVVEDDELTATLYNSLFRRLAGEFQCAIERTGAGGMRRLKDAAPDALILDWDLPDITGIDILKALRANPSTRNLPVVIVSGRSAPSDVAHALRLGADGYFCKPFNLAELLKRLRELIGQ